MAIHPSEVSGLISPSDRRDMEPDEPACPLCGEPCGTPNVEAYEVAGVICCDDCAPEVLEANGQFGVGA